jgi:hypothetical protein
VPIKSVQGLAFELFGGQLFPLIDVRLVGHVPSSFRCWPVLPLG